MYVDASALVGMLMDEPEGALFADAVAGGGPMITSPLAVYEAAHAVARLRSADLDQSAAIVRAFLRHYGITLVNITAEIGEAAVAASARYGRGRHRASLNMGDCFAYACAQVHGVPILYKGDDFGQTDARPAWPRG